MAANLSDDEKFMLAMLKRFIEIMPHMGAQDIEQQLQLTLRGQSPPLQGTYGNIDVWRLALIHAYGQLEPVQDSLNKLVVRAIELTTGHGPEDLSRELRHALDFLHPHDANGVEHIPPSVSIFDTLRIYSRHADSFALHRSLVIVLEAFAVKAWMRTKVARLIVAFQKALLAEAPLTPLGSFRALLNADRPNEGTEFASYRYVLGNGARAAMPLTLV